MKEALPIYQIRQFESQQVDTDLYVNKINLHAKLHEFAELPHKHDFFLLLFITRGSGTHQVDFKNFDIRPGRFFFIKPGQMHCWELSEDIEGFVFFHSKDFYNRYFQSHDIHYFHFFRNYQDLPFTDLSDSQCQFLDNLLVQFFVEYNGNKKMRIHKIHSIIHLIYIEISRNYTGVVKKTSSLYLEKLNQFETLIEAQYHIKKLPKEYAKQLHMTEKHLNRITKHCLNKTSTELIADRVVIEAKRLLLHSNLQIKQISDKLGFSDNAYFNRFFKKQVSITPKVFRKHHLDS